MVQVSSLALVGYLAPVLVTFLLFITWLILGTRRRRRRRRRLYGSTYPYSDAEMAAAAGGQRNPRIVISQQLIEVLYPQVKYKYWLAGKQNEQQQQQQEQQQKEDLPSGAIAQVRSTSGDNTSGKSAVNTNINDSQERDKDTEDADTSGDNHRTCAICIDQFADDDEIRSLPCRHIFHTVCLDPWVTKKNAFCPLCKRALCGVKKGGGGDRRSWPWRRGSQRASARVVSVSVPEAAVVRGSV
ncbi:putative RING finger protein [Aspergillus luchuensis]|uniref:RING-type E3 ubiquitin transferase n=1 Tax=Aspergillus kawachii TaxID=1069201 RepID=A0A146FIJ0_ASPKA|nr:uncharacterized protein AKAW2_51388S [Aspergillus luchuensis]BCS01047.1 hypothetical protein AKAW2_51388S [Aspergillus luchuensis]BCS12802.1 hypothetical protein ALUC_50848S [Aspergillus luchuensis]GAT25790.1 similar to An04g03740 [Aspergillus luchuensis]